MIKKAIILVGVVVLIGLLLYGTHAISYIRTSAGYVADSVREAVPIGFEIDRAKGMIEDLEPEVRKNMQAIAKEEVELRRLEEQIEGTEARLGKEKDHLMRLQSDLATGKDLFQYVGRSYTADQVKADLVNRFQRYRTGDETLASLRQIHAARQKSLEAARRKLEGMLAAKRQLEVEIENLAAQQKMIAATRAGSQYQFDDSRLGRVKQLVCDLRTRLEVDATLAEAESQFHDGIPLDEVDPEDVVDQVTRYFQTEAPPVEAIAVETIAETN